MESGIVLMQFDMFAEPVSDDFTPSFVNEHGVYLEPREELIIEPKCLGRYGHLTMRLHRSADGLYLASCSFGGPKEGFAFPAGESHTKKYKVRSDCIYQNLMKIKHRIPEKVFTEAMEVFK